MKDKFEKIFRQIQEMEHKTETKLGFTAVLQPIPSSCCGQACVATLANKTLEESIAVFGKASGTSTNDVVEALNKFGVRCGTFLKRVSGHNQKSDVCIVRQRFKGEKHTHWVVFIRATRENGLLYDIYLDPSWGVMKGYHEEYVREISFLPIYLRFKEQV
jgi:predicted double-glycine peptidase